MRPQFAEAIPGSASLAQRKAPVTLTSKARLHPSGGVAATGSGTPGVPALFMRMVTASSDEMVVKVYPLGHETTYLCASRQRRRARNPGGGIALAGCLHLAPLCQILIASDRGENAYQIARSLGCNSQTVRNAIHAFNEKGLPQALWQGSKRPHT